MRWQSAALHDLAWARTRTLVAVVAVAAIVPYLNALRADFTFDDIGVVRDNAAVQVLPAAGLLTYVHEPGSLYRPLTMLTYAANSSASPDPFGFHLVNVILHALVSVAMLCLALRIFADPGTSEGRSASSIATRSRKTVPRHVDHAGEGPARHTGVGHTQAALLAAVLFAVHPIHTEAVTNVVGRAELLAALGVLVSLLAFARMLDSSAGLRTAWLAASLAAYAGSMLSKESAFTALGLIAVLHWWLRRGATLRAHARALAPHAAVAATYLLLRWAVLGTLALRRPPSLLDNPLAHTDTWTRLRTATVILWEYASQVTFPVHLSADYSLAQIPLVEHWSDSTFLVAAIALTALAICVLVAGRRRPVLWVAALFIVIPLGLTANLAFPIGTIKAERLLYLPSVGYCLAAAWVATAFSCRRGAWAVVLIGIVVIALAARTWARNADWQDDQTLFLGTVATVPGSAKAHHNLAVVRVRAGDLVDAEAEYREALRLNPGYATAALGIGTTYQLRGNVEQALLWAEAALRIDSHFVKAHRRLCSLRYDRSEYDAAEAACRSGLAEDPNDLVLLAQLSAVRVAQGDPWEARALLVRLDQFGTLDAGERTIIETLRQRIESELQ